MQADQEKRRGRVVADLLLAAAATAPALSVHAATAQEWVSLAADPDKAQEQMRATLQAANEQIIDAVLAAQHCVTRSGKMTDEELYRRLYRGPNGIHAHAELWREIGIHRLGGPSHLYGGLAMNIIRLVWLTATTRTQINEFLDYAKVATK